MTNIDRRRITNAVKTALGTNTLTFNPFPNDHLSPAQEQQHLKEELFSLKKDSSQFYNLFVL